MPHFRIPHRSTRSGRNPLGRHLAAAFQYGFGALMGLYLSTLLIDAGIQGQTSPGRLAPVPYPSRSGT